ncbi:hypothetical protein BV25DRAFT_201865 [Artomyces pyxidatus]|uniref:Uncharacterized protein n=1 Tax=Artomyces pyxidatus TaxID=48021 RepID=A0ACB8T7X7_9AGAM|nr:hypothetical protein BV25DRAFT_201865 [Artomyces pyxidatus]
MPSIDFSYCVICDQYFPSSDARASHVQSSPNHPECKTCKVRFATKTALRSHWETSSKHHYCAVCEHHFKTSAGLRVHVETSAVHNDDSDDDSDNDYDEAEELPDGWEDIYGHFVYPKEDARVAELGEDLDAIDIFDDFLEEELLSSEDELSPNVGGAAVLVNAVRSNHTHSEISKIVKAHFESVTAKEQSNPRGMMVTCPICLLPPVQSSATRCGHLFCSGQVSLQS